MFGEVRSLLQHKPDAEIWEALCQQLSDWRGPEDLESVVIPYILAHIQEWPHHLRGTPLRWKEGLVRGANLPFARLIKHLDASHMGLRNEDLLTLARAPVMAHVASIDFSHNAIGWRGLSHLLEETRHLERLRALSFDHTGIGVEGIRLIAQTQSLRDLESLSLRAVQTSPEGIRALMQSPSLKSLKKLAISKNGLVERHISALLDGERFAQLRTLLLDDNPLGSRGVIRLFHQRSTVNLEALDLSSCNLSAPIATLLAQTRALPNLRTLRVAHNPLVRHCERFRDASHLSSLRELDVCGHGDEYDSLVTLFRHHAPPPYLERLAISSGPRCEDLEALTQQHGVSLTHRITIDMSPDHAFGGEDGEEEGRAGEEDDAFSHAEHARM